MPTKPSKLPELFCKLSGYHFYLFGQSVPCRDYPEHPNLKKIVFTLITTHKDGPKPEIQKLRHPDIFFTNDKLERAKKGKPNDGVYDEHFYFGFDLFKAARKLFKIGVSSNIYTKKLFNEYVLAGRPKFKNKWLRERLLNDYKCLSQMPKWREHGIWPHTHDGNPMLFVDQTLIPKNTVTRAHLYDHIMLFVFVGLRGTKPIFKFNEIIVGHQTAKEHYKSETENALDEL